jgi:hypothetical protein
VAIERPNLGLAAGIAFNLGLLAFFKYKFLFIDAATPSSQALHIRTQAQSTGC